jgi:hypothetical protein
MASGVILVFERPRFRRNRTVFIRMGAGTRMFAGWSEFYTLLGEASATLIGLLFVVSTLTSTADAERRTGGQTLFLTPTVFKFGSLLALSAVALAPGLSPGARRALCAGVGVVGLLNLGGVSTALLRGNVHVPVHWSDPWCYGVVPTLLFAAFALCPVLLDPTDAARGVGAAAAALLLLAVRNAWDLVTTLTGVAAERGNGG